MKNTNKMEVSKIIDNYALYLYADVFDDLKTLLDGLVSEGTAELLCNCSKAIRNEVGHLKCDELTDCKVIEYGYNFK